MDWGGVGGRRGKWIGEWEGIGGVRRGGWIGEWGRGGWLGRGR